MTGPGPSFLLFLETHRSLDNLFLEHQRALLDRDLDAASGSLLLFSHALEVHMAEEEEVMLPLFGERAGRIEGGGVDLFLGEHEKMRLLVRRLADRIAGLVARGETTDRDILDLLHEESAFRHLLEHHDARERNVLYPKLDEITRPEEREGFFERIRAAREGDERRPRDR